MLFAELFFFGLTHSLYTNYKSHSPIFGVVQNELNHLQKVPFFITFSTCPQLAS